VRSRISLILALLATVLGAGTAVASNDGPVVSEFGTGITLGGLWGIADGPDGNLWFSQETLGGIGRITPGAVITQFTSGFPIGSPRGIVTGPDGNLWVAMAGGNGAIAKVTKTGVVTEFPVITPGDPTDITVGPDGNLWYTDPAAHLVARITTGGSITEFTIPTANSDPSEIVLGSDGALWFTENLGNKIGRIATAPPFVPPALPPPLPVVPAPTSVSQTSTKTCKVPRLRGLSLAKARKKLKKAGCKYKLRGKGYVVSTSPKAGKSTSKPVLVKCKPKKRKGKR
jgi:streptogramin lyase